MHNEVDLVVHQGDCNVFNWSKNVVRSEDADLGEAVVALEEFVALWIWFPVVLGERASLEVISTCWGARKTSRGNHFVDGFWVSADVVPIVVAILVILIQRSAIAQTLLDELVVVTWFWNCGSEFSLHLACGA